MPERMRAYELMLVTIPLSSEEEQLQNVIGRVEQSVEDVGGEILKITYDPPWGRRKLAYPIRAYLGGEASRRSFTEGFYILMQMNLPSEGITTIERTIKLIEPVLRHLIILMEDTPLSDEGEESAMAQLEDDISLSADNEDDEEDEEDEDIPDLDAEADEEETGSDIDEVAEVSDSTDTR